VFAWDPNNLRKIRAHRIKREEVEQTLVNEPFAIYDQYVEGEPRFVYYCKTDAGRFLAVIVTSGTMPSERDYLERRRRGE
jgi:uncharacterized DUF497 family protein